MNVSRLYSEILIDLDDNVKRRALQKILRNYNIKLVRTHDIDFYEDLLIECKFVPEDVSFTCIYLDYMEKHNYEILKVIHNIRKRKVGIPN